MLSCECGVWFTEAQALLRCFWSKSACARLTCFTWPCAHPFKGSTTSNSSARGG